MTNIHHDEPIEVAINKLMSDQRKEFWRCEMKARQDSRTKLNKDNNPINKIYFTRGDNGYNKCAGIGIGDKIYWIKGQFSNLDDLSQKLDPLGVSISRQGDWGFWDGISAPLNKRVTHIRHHIEEVFEKESFYVKNAQFAPDSTLWWSVDDIKMQILDPLESV